VIERSTGPAPTAVAAVEVLFAASGSLVALLTVAVFEIVDPPGTELSTFTVSVIVAEPAAMSVPRLQVTVDVPVQEPCDVFTETNVVFAGMASETETLLASDGPLLVTVSVYVAFEPAVTLAGPVFAIATSADVPAVVDAVEVLLPALGSAVVLLTVAVFEIVDPFAMPALAFTVSVIVAAPALTIVPRLQVTVAVPVQVPCDGVAATNDVFAGSVSETDTASASDGPLFATLSVYVMFEPALTVAGPLLVMLTSAEVLTVVDAVEVLFAPFVSVVVVVALAVFEIVEPFAAPLFVFTTIWNVAVAPFARLAIVQVTVAPPVQPNDGPTVCVTETNDVAAGIVSVIETFAAAMQQLFVFDTVTV
jgi:hypothetical protein